MIVITGASHGLGLELAKLYQQAGKTVVNISRTPSSAADTNIKADLQAAAEVEQAAAAVLALDEPLEALVNNAGVYGKQPLERTDAALVRRLLAVNAEAAMLLTGKLLERIRGDGADVVNVASTAGLKGNANEAAYGASKWAMRGFSASLQAELKSSPCRVISFCPGGMNTALFTSGHTDGGAPDNSAWMPPQAVAACLKQLLDLPKQVEVSEIVLNRKSL